MTMATKEDIAPLVTGTSTVAEAQEAIDDDPAGYVTHVWRNSIWVNDGEVYVEFRPPISGPVGLMEPSWLIYDTVNSLRIELPVG